MISQSSGTLIAEFRAESADSIGPRWLALRSRMLPGKEGSTQRIVGIVIDVTERVRLRETIEASRDEVRALAASLLSAAETERSRVAHNLHDRICQQLASLAIDMGGLAEDSESPSLTRDDLKALQARIVVASEETRHIAYELHPTVLEDLGLIASLQELCREFSASVPDLDIRLKSAVLPAAIQLEAASCVYRVAEEGMNNVVKHAGATHITISLRTRRQSLVMTLSDDGRGFDMQAAKGKGRLGLIGLEERVRLVGGTLAISARKPHGTWIILSIPIGAGKTVRGKTPLKQ